MKKNNLQLTKKETEGIKEIRRWFMDHSRGPSVRELTKLMGYGSTRTAAKLINSLIEKKVLYRGNDNRLKLLKDASENNLNAHTIEVPLVGNIACGAPIFADENIQAYIPISVSFINLGYRYYFLRACGDSMNLAGINDGDLLLIRQQSTADIGQKVVALIDDEATVKIFEVTSEAIILKPKSDNKKHQPIILNRDFLIQGIVVTVLPAELFDLNVIKKNP